MGIFDDDRIEFAGKGYNLPSFMIGADEDSQATKEIYDLDKEMKNEYDRNLRKLRKQGKSKSMRYRIKDK